MTSPSQLWASMWRYLLPASPASTASPEATWRLIDRVDNLRLKREGNQHVIMPRLHNQYGYHLKKRSGDSLKDSEDGLLKRTEDSRIRMLKRQKAILMEPYGLDPYDPVSIWQYGQWRRQEELMKKMARQNSRQKDLEDIMGAMQSFLVNIKPA